MNACDRMVPLILRSAEQVLDEADRVRLTAHLASCAACRAALAEQSEVRQWLAQVPLPAVSDGFAARVRQQALPAAEWIGLLDWRRWTLGLAPLAAALVLVAVLAGREAAPATTTAGAITTWAQGSHVSTARVLDPSADMDTVISAAMGEGSR